MAWLSEGRPVRTLIGLLIKVFYRSELMLDFCDEALFQFVSLVRVTCLRRALCREELFGTFFFFFFKKKKSMMAAKDGRESWTRVE